MSTSKVFTPTGFGWIYIPSKSYGYCIISGDRKMNGKMNLDKDDIIIALLILILFLIVMLVGRVFYTP
ncbi:MAG: hypothetical protein KKI06_10825 [Euryarchaeota archaeon]|nr:hypothetical protein [Euryarchaeota archaeon]